MEKILKIEEVLNFKEDDDDYTGFDGYKITTDQQEIVVLISNGQNCCENWGYFVSSEDKLDSFIGTNLLKVEIVDVVYNKKEWDNKFPYGLDEGNVAFINFETDKGLFQLTVYNAHNGYYGHSVIIKSRDIDERMGL